MTKLYDPDKIVVVVGYPRSGNSHLAGLIGEALDSPVMGFMSALPLSTEGEGRSGSYYVTQLHLRVTRCESEQAIFDAWKFNPNAYAGERIVHIARDPRDVAVSAKFYWDIPSIRDTLIAMRDGAHPLMGVGDWNSFVGGWMRFRDETKGLPCRFATTGFEKLIEDPIDELAKIFYALELPLPDHERLDNVVNNRRIEARRAHMETHGDDHPYGKTIQLKHLRKGVVGDWRNHFSESDIALAEEIFGRDILAIWN